MQLATTLECLTYFRSQTWARIARGYALAISLLLLAPLTPAAAAALSIAGSPETSVTVPNTYTFQPTVSGASGTVTFSIKNKPFWATFNSSTGLLSGQPNDNELGTYSNVAITATAGTTSASLPAWSIVVKYGSGTSAPPPGGSSGSLAISGTPPTTVKVPNTYSFQPTVSGGNGSTVTFSVKNKPFWATFNSSTGMLSGQPNNNELGTYSNVAITATAGTSTAALSPWSIVVSYGSGSTSTPTPDTPVISGAPAASVAVGTAYRFQPTASDPAGHALTFSINTKPSWASFSTTTGLLSGTPAAANVGTVSNIVITASNGSASASLPAFSLTVTQVGDGSVTLSWLPPTQNTNGTALTNLAGYDIKYGTSASSLTQTIQVANPGLTQYVVPGLSPGVWYFGVVAYTSSGAQSNLSSVVQTTVN